MANFPNSNPAKGLRVYFLGSGDIAVPVLAQLVANTNVTLVGCGTQPDRPQGRKRKLTATAIGQYAAANALPVDKPESVKAPEFLDRLRQLCPSLILVFAFGQILSKELLSLPPFGCINIHASLLPRYRGASPVNAAIAMGDDRTGISVMKMARGLDSGPVYQQFELTIAGRERAPELSERLAVLAAERIGDTLLRIASGELTAEKQDEAQVSLAPKLRKEDGCISWCEPAAVIERQVRAYHPWPGAWCRAVASAAGQNKGGSTSMKEKKLVITDAAVCPNIADAEPGTVIQADKHAWSIACGEDALEIQKLIPEGKREMTGTEFIRGFPIHLGNILNEKHVRQCRKPADASCAHH